VDKKGRVYYYGEAVIGVSSLDPAYIKEVSLAYEKAMLNLQANFILQTFGKMSVKKIYESFEDDSTNADQFPPLQKATHLANEGKIGIIFDKYLDVISNTLDQKLREQGVPESKISKLSIEQKKQLWKNNFTSVMTKKAFKSMQGLVPRKIKIGDRDGATVLAIIAIQSKKTIQFAQDIARKRVSHVQGKPRSL